MNRQERTAALACCLVLLGLWARAAQGPSDPPSVPEEFQRLIESANVSFAFYDPRQQPRRLQGHTSYHLELSHECSYRYQGSDRNSGLRVVLRLTFQKIACHVENVVELPARLDTPRKWNDALVAHEFDHVALTVDPRLRMLAEQLYRSVSPLVLDVDRETPVDRAYLESQVDDSLAPRRQAILDLLIANQQYLDEVTQHGAQASGRSPGLLSRVVRGGKSAASVLSLPGRAARPAAAGPLSRM